jgi:RNA polymerase sigma factor (sigma-70 family)
LAQTDDAECTASESLAEALTRYRKQLARRIAQLVKPYDVEDIVQETYLRLFQAAKREPIRSPRALMLKTARNLALNKLRWADALNHMVTVDDGTDPDSRPGQGLENASEEPTPEAVLEGEQEFSVFCQAIRALPRQCRRVMLLRRVYGLSQREVAVRLGISERTVENHIAKAVVACSDFMDAHGFPRRSLRRQFSTAQTKAQTKAQARRGE